MMHNMDATVGAQIKQEQDPLEISPETLRGLNFKTETDLDNILMKSEDQYCMSCNENCRDNLPIENGLLLKEEIATLECEYNGVVEENSVNKIDCNQEVPRHVFFRCERDYESTFKHWVKEKQRSEMIEDALGDILIHQKLNTPEISPELVRGVKTEIDLDNSMVKIEDPSDMTCDGNSSDNFLSENEVFSNECLSVKTAQSWETLEPEYNGAVVDNLANEIDYDQQDVPAYVFFQQKGELQNDVIKLKQIEREEEETRQKPSKIGKKWKCHLCDFDAKNKSNLNRHILEVHKKSNVKVYDCQQCTFKSIYRHNLRAHIRIHEEKALYKCPGCEKGFNQKIHLDNHLLKSHENLQHLIKCKINCCKFCAYKTTNATNLRRHVAHSHDKDGAEKFQCAKCDYSALRADSLRAHLRVHGEVALHKCPGCKRGFSQKRHLDSHLLKSHENLQHLVTAKMHSCKFCSYITTNTTHLKDHTAYHHDRDAAEKFQCYKCDYSGFRKTDLKRHILTHSNSRPYLCTACEKSFAHKIQLDGHILNSHKENAVLLKTVTEKIYQCTLCKFATVYESLLWRHVRSGKHKYLEAFNKSL